MDSFQKTIPFKASLSELGEAMATLDFYKSVNPISTRGAAYAAQINTAPSPDFRTFLRPTVLQVK
jgi:hypothetical protein